MSDRRFNIGTEIEMRRGFLKIAHQGEKHFHQGEKHFLSEQLGVNWKALFKKVAEKYISEVGEDYIDDVKNQFEHLETTGDLKRMVSLMPDIVSVLAKYPDPVKKYCEMLETQLKSDDFRFLRTDFRHHFLSIAYQGKRALKDAPSSDWDVLVGRQVLEFKKKEEGQLSRLPVPQEHMKEHIDYLVDDAVKAAKEVAAKEVRAKS